MLRPPATASISAARCASESFAIGPHCSTKVELAICACVVASICAAWALSTARSEASAPLL